MITYDDANRIRYAVTDLPLPEGIDRASFNALLTAGVRDVLQQELDALDARRHAGKDAALEVSAAAKWSEVSRFVRDRDAAIKSGAYVERAVL